MNTAAALLLFLASQEPVEVEGQPLAANATRLLQALDFLGAPLPAETEKALRGAVAERDARKIQSVLDPHALAVVSLNPEARVKAARGAAPAVLQEGGWSTFILKVVNDSTVTKTLRVTSPQAGIRYAGGAAGREKGDPAKFLSVEVYGQQPMTRDLSGLRAEYALLLIYSSEAGRREATLSFDVGQGNQDLGFRGEVPILFDVKPAIPVRLSIRDFDGKPTTGRFTFRDKRGRVYPLQAKRLAPDFFFQQQIYRHDGQTVLLPPGAFTMQYGRGPEYKLLTRDVAVPAKGEAAIEVKLERWVNAMDYGFYGGDHHIHAAGCQHYTSPTEGVHAPDMFLHVKGEGLNVGCNLTWGPCYDYQRQFFSPGPDKLSEPFTVLKYDVEVSGFGSQAMGHVCLLNLKDQTYPGSEGTKTKGWPMWTTPLMKWAKAQGAVTGYAHSASGLGINIPQSSSRLLAGLDADKDRRVTPDEAARGFLPLPEPFAAADRNKDGALTEDEILAATERTSRSLPNYVIPQMDGIGAQEICVTAAQGLCDFISAMDTNRVPEWNCWYQIMNCGFPLKVSGETDFPCISGSRVGEGRVYVQLGKVDRVDFTAWCEGLRAGRSYVSDGYAHALDFSVEGKKPGDTVALDAAGRVQAKAKVAFAGAVALGTSKGGAVPPGARKVDLVVNGYAVATKEVPADDQVHEIEFTVPIERSSWVALRHFPQMHTNPVNVLVGGKPIRASRRSALWCVGAIEQLWRVRGGGLPENERAEAQKTFQAAIEQYKKIAAECPEGS